MVSALSVHPLIGREKRFQWGIEAKKSAISRAALSGESEP
jgi:hypothetical protein